MKPQEAIEIMKIAISEVEWEYPMDYAAAFEMAIEAIEKQATKQATSNYTSEWIPVSERLPDDGETYLITNAESFEQYHTYKGWYDGTKGIWHMTGNFERKMNVIAWMPLPEPYKRESE